jgi:hypothetical protein
MGMRFRELRAQFEAIYEGAGHRRHGETARRADCRRRLYSAKNELGLLSIALDGNTAASV